jgi:microcystin-dependent protein
MPAREGKGGGGTAVTPYVGQIISVAFNFTPEGWLPCDGSLQSIDEFQALFVLIGTTYGGNGTTNFALPDLRGRSPVNQGQGANLSNYILGQRAGAESISVLANQVGSHNHPLMASSQAGTISNPATTVALGQNPQGAVFVYGPPPTTTSLAGASIGLNSSGNQPHENRQPLLAINYIIAAFGVFPSQS